MRESLIYQEILQEGEQKGRQEGRQEEGALLVLRQLTRWFGAIDETVRSQITTLPLPLLEDLAEALIDFTELTDLTNWLQFHQF